MRINNNFQLSTLHFQLPTLIVVLLLLLLAACQDDYSHTVATDDSDVPVSVQLRTTPKAYVGVKTRAGDLESDQIDDLTVLQFKRHKLIRKYEYTSEELTGTISESTLNAMGATNLDENGNVDPDGNGNVVVCLANFKTDFQNLLDQMDAESGTSYTALTATLADVSALTGLTIMPLVGYYHGALKPDEPNPIDVTLSPALAKINFTVDVSEFKSNGASPVFVDIESITLHNVPKTMVFVPSTPTYPEVSEESVMTLTAEHNLAADKLKGFTSYMPANARGNYEAAITSNADKYPESVDANDPPAGWTYIQVVAIYANGVDKASRVTYKVYLGGDAAGDVNILAGHQYDINIKLRGAHPKDFVIEATEVKNANCYMVNPTTTGLVIPMEQAVLGWQWMQDYGDIGSGHVNTLTALLADTEKWSVELLWCTWDGFSTADNRITFQQQVTATSPYPVIVLSNLNKVPSGHNAVIALKDTENEDIWWTWHLWFTDYAPTGTGATNGEVHTYISDAFKTNGTYEHSVMMDRNLGATGSGTINAQPSNDDAPKWFGMHYQWGRKDPFTPSASTSIDSGVGTGSVPMANAVKIFNANGVQIVYTDWHGDFVTTEVKGSSGVALVKYTTNLAHHDDGFPKISTPNATTNRLIDATRMPYIYFYRSGDWTARNDNLWGGGTSTVTGKTPFDPCPDGWRVPKGGTTVIDNPWAGFGASGGTAVTSGNNNTTFAFWGSTGSGNTTAAPRAGRLYTGTNKDATITNVNAWYPASGYRDYSTGAFDNVGSNGYYWSAAITSTFGYYLYFTSASVSPALSNYRASGYAVRCAQE